MVTRPDHHAVSLSPLTASGPDTILLDPFAARSCPVRTQNQFDPTVPDPPATGIDDLTEEVRRLVAASREYRGEILDRLSARPDGDVRDLRGLTDRPALEATAAAIDAGVVAIISPALPDDPVGHRRGRPDLVVRGADRPDGSPGYVPVSVRHHKVREARGTEVVGRISALEHPSPGSAGTIPGLTVRSTREPDLLPLVHHWLLLEAAGWSAGDGPLVGLIGTDEPALPRHRIVAGRLVQSATPGIEILWIDPRERLLPTYARRREDHWVLRSPMERYEHEFGFRLTVARVASQHTGSPDDPPPVVRPIVVRECESCRWRLRCQAELAGDDLSVAISKNRLDAKEIATLRSLGIRTVDDLADADLDEILPAYLPEVGHRPSADARLRMAAHRSRLLRSGIELERTTTGPVPVPRSGLEIDLDLETTAGNRVYLWGFLVDGPERHYRDFSSFEDLDTPAELALANRALTWLDDVVAAHPETLVYHYSGFEPHHIRTLAARSGDAELIARANRVLTHMVDLFAIVRTNFFGTHGLGLKKVASAGAGFSWRDEDPGGLNSQSWFDQAVHDPDPDVRAAARRRVLEYNEDDVRATFALRRWLRAEHSA